MESRFIRTLVAAATVFVLVVPQHAETAPGRIGAPTGFAGGPVGRLEAIIDAAYQKCFHTVMVAGGAVTIRMPFAQEQAGGDGPGGELAVAGGGKAEPRALWGLVDAAVRSPDFASYARALREARDKVVAFDLERGSWRALGDWHSIALVKAGLRPPAQDGPVALFPGEHLPPEAIYDYLHCVTRMGLDCSGFVWFVLKEIARAGGADLDALVAPELRAAWQGSVPLYISASFFDPRSGHVQEVVDAPRTLRPGDVIAFRGEEGSVVHSAVIQSVDLSGGAIRYLQCTDLAPREQRGVHDSLITFDPARPEVSIADATVVWHQRTGLPFVGDPAPRYRSDGERYRARTPLGGSCVVRLRALRGIPEKLQGEAPGAWLRQR